MSIIDRSLVEEIVQIVFTTMFGLELQSEAGDSEPIADGVASAVHVSGDWAGSVVVRQSPGISRKAASTFMKIPLDDVTEVDQEEVAGELANMIGGNLKGVLQGTSRLTIPEVAFINEAELSTPIGDLIEEVTLNHPTGSISVHVYESVHQVS